MSFIKRCRRFVTALGVLSLMTLQTSFVPSVSAQTLLIDPGCDANPAKAVRSNLQDGIQGPWTEEGTAAYYRAEFIYREFILRGFSAAGAAGPVGNGFMESGGSFHPAILEESGSEYTGQGLAIPMPEIASYGKFLPSSGDVLGITNYGKYIGPVGSVCTNSSVACGGYGIFQITPGQRMYDEGGGETGIAGPNGFQYTEPMGSARPESSNYDSNWRENLMDTDMVGQAILVELDYIFLAYDGAALGRYGQGLKSALLSSSEVFSRVAEPLFADEAAYGFYYFVENGVDRGVYYGRAGGQERDLAAEKAYEMFSAAGPEWNPSQADRTLIEAIEAKAEPRARRVNSGLPPCKEEDEPMDIIEIAAALVGHWCYDNDERQSVLQYIDDIGPGKHMAGTDCSGFVYFVLKKAGYRVPDMMWTTSTIHADIMGKQEYLERISPSEAKAGDIINYNEGCGVGGNCVDHVAILAEPFHGPSTKIYEMGGARNGLGYTTGGPLGVRSGCDAVDGPEQNAIAASAMGRGDINSPNLTFGRPKK